MFVCVVCRFVRTRYDKESREPNVSKIVIVYNILYMYYIYIIIDSVILS